MGKSLKIVVLIGIAAILIIGAVVFVGCTDKDAEDKVPFTIVTEF